MASLAPVLLLLELLLLLHASIAHTAVQTYMLMLTTAVNAG
jgi:hypothetical protein